MVKNSEIMEKEKEEKEKEKMKKEKEENMMEKLSSKILPSEGREA